MTDFSDISREFGELFDDSWLPKQFTEKYCAQECLSDNGGCVTLLAVDRATGEKCVAKCYPNDGRFSSVSEGEILSKLSHEGVPGFIGEYRNDETLCVVRSYIDGVTLDEYARSHPYSRADAAELGVELCDILIALNDKEKHIVHRDIKPQNIIIDNDGKAHLIDFGISRINNEDKENDTVISATAIFAPPEQYGFFQTDVRSDIYSLGVVINYLLTGSTDIRHIDKKKCGSSFYRIIKKCTAFSPNERYHSAKQLKRDLCAWDKPRIGWGIGIALAAAVCIVLFGAFAAFGFGASEGTTAPVQPVRPIRNYEYSKITNAVDNSVMRIAARSKIVIQTENTKVFGGHRYRVIEKNLGSWDNMRDYCEMLGGHLATVNTPNEDEFIFSLVRDCGYDRAHIGLYLEDFSEWKWVTGEPFVYSNWAIGEPNNLEKKYRSKHEVYTMYYGDYFPEGGWNNGDYYECISFVCEWDQLL